MGISFVQKPGGLVYEDGFYAASAMEATIRYCIKLPAFQFVLGDKPQHPSAAFTEFPAYHSKFIKKVKKQADVTASLRGSPRGAHPPHTLSLIHIYLLDTFSIEDNIFLPLVLSRQPHKVMQQRLGPIAQKLGIGEILQKYPYEVSGGQKQRAAVARALITNPQIILADEPTGALDSKAATKLLRMLHDINADGQTILMVTHSIRAASHAGRVLFIKDGEVFHQIYRGQMTNDELYQKISDTLTVLTTGGKDVE